MGVAAIAEAAGINRQTVLADIASGLLPAMKIGNAFWVRGAHAKLYIEARREYFQHQRAAQACLEGFRAAMQKRTTKRSPRRRG